MIKMASPLTKIGRLAGILEQYSRNGTRLLMEPIEPGTPDYDSNVKEIYGAAERSARIANMHVSRRVALPLIALGLVGVSCGAYNLLYGKSSQLEVTTTRTTSNNTPKDNLSTTIVVVSKTVSSTTPTESTNKLFFYYDPNLNNQKDENEPLLSGLHINQDDKTVEYHDGYIDVPRNSTVKLVVTGTTPNGKPLINCTLQEPNRPLSITNLKIDSLEQDIFLGLADGYATSPLKSGDANYAKYELWKNDLDIARQIFLPYYPTGWPYSPNYLLYGYRIAEGSFTGRPHIALDHQSSPGKHVHAVFGGDIIPPIYDYKFGIKNDIGVMFYNHINPTVSIGDSVPRYADVGTIDNSGNNHVHIQYGMNMYSDEATKILDIFSTLKKDDILKSPFKGENPPVLPYFGN